MAPSLVLASSSPFRQMLMKNAGLEFEAVAANIDERAIEASLEQGNGTPDEVARILAREKAREVSTRFPKALVIGSDQTMSLGSRVYHKPVDIAQAREHLLSLSGKVHRLNSSVAFVRNGELLWDTVEHADLTVRRLSEAFVDAHLCRVGEKALSSVGAYQLEGEGIQLFSRIDGDYFTILGLPMLPVLNKLREFGLLDA